MDYRAWALLSALFAGLTALLSKKGVEGVPPNLALAVRVATVLILAIGLAVATRQTDLRSLPPRAWTFLVLSGLATGASWLCYFRALAAGPLSRVAPIDKLSFVLAALLGVAFLGERITLWQGVGGLMIVAGVLVTLR
jgi:transporter family protein